MTMNAFDCSDLCLIPTFCFSGGRPLTGQNSGGGASAASASSDAKSSSSGASASDKTDKDLDGEEPMQYSTSGNAQPAAAQGATARR